MKHRRHTDCDDEGTDINLAPLLDIVFIMLIFFVVTTSFIKEAGIDVTRPVAKTAESNKRGNIMVAIAPNREIWIDKRPVDIRSVRAVIERLRAEYPEGAVIIQGDREAQIGLLVEVMDQVRKGGVNNVSIAATRDE